MAGFLRKAATVYRSTLAVFFKDAAIVTNYLEITILAKKIAKNLSTLVVFFKDADSINTFFRNYKLGSKNSKILF